MIEILQFIFGSFWRFAGTAVLLTIVVQGIVAIAGILKGGS